MRVFDVHCGVPLGHGKVVVRVGVGGDPEHVYHLRGSVHLVTPS